MSAPTNPYRDTMTRDLEAVRQSLAWDLAEYEADAASFAGLDDVPTLTVNAVDYLRCALDLADAELNRRQRLRGRPSAPSWPEQRADVERVKAAVDLVEFVEVHGGVQLRRCGRRWRAFCPFPDHQAHSAGFAVDRETGLWHCFGCGRGGDVFTFAQEWYGFGFRDALGLVNTHAGVTVVGFKPPRGRSIAPVSDTEPLALPSGFEPVRSAGRRR